MLDVRCPFCGKRIDPLVDSCFYKLAKQSLEIKFLVDKQANNDGLWFVAETAAEGYLQQELRNLHAVIEGGTE